MLWKPGFVQFVNIFIYTHAYKNLDSHKNMHVHILHAHAHTSISGNLMDLSGTAEGTGSVQ